MKRVKILSLFSFLVLVIAGGSAYGNDVQQGKELYLSSKYRCYSCHGQNGEGASGPSFKGIGKKYDLETLIKKAAHNCPPTGMCSPKEMRLMAIFLRTL